MARLRRHIHAVVLAASAAALVSAAERGAEQTPSEFARSLQRKYDAVKDFSADFVHIYEGGVLRKQITERGRVLIKKPGKMRWTYTAPEEKLFVSDGVKLYSYIPQDRQVLVATVPKNDEANTPAMFLAGKGDLSRDFTPSFADVPAGLPAGSIALKLVPKSPQREYDWVVLAVDPASMAIRGLATTDAQGGKSTFSFANLKENGGLADTIFEFKIPRGVDVVTDAGR